jgi:hypothetical protein
LTVVRVADVDGGQELLAVGNYLAGATPETSDAPEPAPLPDVVEVSGPLPLPYALPN